MRTSSKSFVSNSSMIERGAASITLHTNLLGVGGFVYIPHMSDPLKKLGLDFKKVHKLGHKLMQLYAYKLVSTLCALEKSIDNSRHNSQEGGSARHPPDPH